MIWKRIFKAKSRTKRSMRLESLESRRLMAADPIKVGLVYLETDYLESDQDVGSDSRGDRFLLSFSGGAAGTELSELRISTDKDGDGVTVGDLIFDTAAGGRGKNGFHPFNVHKITTTDGSTATVNATVEDGGTELVLRFNGFSAGDRLEFTIDVDEVLRLSPDLAVFNSRLDVISSGQEFQDSILKAKFDAPNYFTADATSVFLNDFGDPWTAARLNLPPDEGPSVDSRPNRSAAALAETQQRPIPASISGFVYRDDNDSATKDPGEIGLSGIRVRLEPISTIEPQSPLIATTAADGSYRFTNVMPGRYRIVELDQPTNLADGRDTAGTIAGRVVGSAVNPGDEIRDIELRGGDSGINYNFGELPLGSIAGFVYLAAPGADCDGTHDATDSTPLAGVELRLIDAAGATVKTTRTGADGAYRFSDLVAGIYRVVEITPAGLFDGGSHVGEMRSISNPLFVSVGTSVDGGTIANIALPPGGDGQHYNFCEAAPASLAGNVYHDRDNDGLRDAGEEPISGVELTLIGGGGSVVAVTRTTPDGKYKFDNLAPGNYRIVETQPSGFIDGLDTPGTISGATVGRNGGDGDSLVDIVLRQGLHGVDYNFGERQVASLSGRVHVDLDEDCVFDPNEQPLSGVTISLLNNNGNLVRQTTTDSQGRYEFADLVPGTYTIVETQPVGYFEGGATPGTLGGRTDGPNRITQVTLGSGVDAENYDFCERPPAEISGVVYIDRDADCVRDEGEAGIGNVLVELLDESGRVIASQRTAADGSYRFANLTAGIYSVRESQPVGFFQGGQTAGNRGGDVSQADLIAAIPIVWGDTLVQYNFCERLPAELAGVVYVDRNADCVQDPGEEGLAGVLVELFGEDGRLVASTTTDATGNYRFTNLRAGNYTVRESQPVGYFHGGQRAGNRGGDDSVADVISSIPVFWGDTLVRYDFCELLPSQISGVVYVDGNGDCIQDPAEPGLAGVLVQLFSEDGSLVGTTTTAADGSYQFTNLRAGTYTLRETQPAGYLQGGQVAGSDGGDASVADVISAIPIGWGQSLTRYDFCELLPSTLSGRVYSDTQANRRFDGGDSGIANVPIELVNASGTVIATTRTDADGRYRFENLTPGVYEVRESQPAGFFHGGQVAGNFGGDATISDRLSAIRLPSGGQGVDYDFPELLPASISGYVFQDGDALRLSSAPDPKRLREFRDGQLTSDDTRLASVTLELRNVLGLPVDSQSVALPGTYADGPIIVTTNPLGYYEFVGLRPGATYSVYQVQPDELIDSLDTPGVTSATAVNEADLADEDGSIRFQIQQLSNNPLTDPRFDAILNLFVLPGQTVANNNFSEIAISEPDLPPWAVPTPPPVQRPTSPIETFDAILRPVALAEPLQARSPIVADDEWEVSWHLSVINGGYPRGKDRPDNDGSTAQLGQPMVRRVGYRDDGTADEAVMELETGSMPDELLRRDLIAGHWRVVVSSTETLSDATRGQSRTMLGHEDATALTGDFDGDGVDEAVLFIGGQWFVDLNGNGVWDAGDLWIRLGTELDRPVIGDWDGDGKDDVAIFGRRWQQDEIRIRRDPGLPDPANTRRRGLRREDLVHREPTEQEKRQRVLLRGEDGGIDADAVDHVFQYGEQVDTPLAGDWNGDGIDQIGVFRGGQWRLDEDGDGRWTKRDRPITFGEAGDEPIVGDFDGDGIDEIGVVRGDLWIIDSDGDRKLTGNDRQFRVPRERADSQPIVGDFDGDQKDDPGYYSAKAS